MNIKFALHVYTPNMRRIPTTLAVENEYNFTHLVTVNGHVLYTLALGNEYNLYVL